MPDALSMIGATSRRQFLRAAGLTGAALLSADWGGGAAIAADGTPADHPTVGPADGDFQFAAVPGRTLDEKALNYALTLETLEADLYRQALNRASGNPGSLPIQRDPSFYKRAVAGGGLSPTLANAGFAYLLRTAYVEASHRTALTTTIESGGGTPVGRNPGGYGFVYAPKPTIKSLLRSILPVEEMGVRAYLGALPYFTDPALASVAGRIHAAEGRHVAALRETLGLATGPAPAASDYPLPPRTVIPLASTYFR